MFLRSRPGNERLAFSVPQAEYGNQKDESEPDGDKRALELRDQPNKDFL